MDKRTFLAAGASAAALSLLSTGCTTTGPGGSGDPAARRKAIDAEVDNALARLYQQAGGSQELVARSAGVLVFPSVVSGGFIVGGSHGNGALRKGGKTTGYYSMSAASVGLLAGGQSRALFILFVTPDALKRFEASSGWTAGVDASVSMITVGANARVTSQDVQQPVVGFVLTNAGFMADLSLNGTRVTRLDL
jgi:lipid-binding SYLF domain-containing protein